VAVAPLDRLTEGEVQLRRDGPLCAHSQLCVLLSAKPTLQEISSGRRCTPSMTIFAAGAWGRARWGLERRESLSRNRPRWR